ncbi:Polyribonucleotide nucleotidyltransferase [bacterium AB1]|nr:Polyribonucleotide nucleotidyltransferase [bacterium AB1]
MHNFNFLDIKCSIEYKESLNFYILFKYNKTSIYVFINNKSEEEYYKKLTVNIYDKSYSKGRIPTSKNKIENFSSDQNIYRSTLIEKALSSMIKKQHNLNISIMLVDHYIEDSIINVFLLGASAALKLYLKNDYSLIIPYPISLCELSDMFLCVSKEGITYLDGFLNINPGYLNNAIKNFFNENQSIIINQCKDIESVINQIQTSNNLNLSQEYDNNLINYILDKSIHYIHSQNIAITQFKQISQIVDNIMKQENHENTNNINFIIMLQLCKTLSLKERLDKRLYNQIRPLKYEINKFSRSNSNILIIKGFSEILINIVMGSFNDVLYEEISELNMVKKKYTYIHYISNQYSMGRGGNKTLKKIECFYNKYLESIIQPIAMKNKFTLKISCDPISADGGLDIMAAIGSSICLSQTQNLENSYVYGVEYSIYNLKNSQSVIYVDPTFIEYICSNVVVKITKYIDSNNISLLYYAHNAEGVSYNDIDNLCNVISDFIQNPKHISQINILKTL